MESIELNSGESVYCINQGQLKRAYEIEKSEIDLQEICNGIQSKLTRNQQAALAFILIDRLQHSA